MMGTDFEQVRCIADFFSAARSYADIWEIVFGHEMISSQLSVITASD